MDVDGEPFESLPYLAADFDPDRNEVKTLFAEIKINDKRVLSGTMEWQPKAFAYRIYSQIADDEPIDSISVKNVKDTKAAILNELIGVLAIQENIATLKELELYKWGVSEPLDGSILQPLASKCNNLTDLKVTVMFEASDDTRLALGRIVETVLAQCPSIATVNF